MAFAWDFGILFNVLDGLNAIDEQGDYGPLRPNQVVVPSKGLERASQSVDVRFCDEPATVLVVEATPPVRFADVRLVTDRISFSVLRRAKLNATVDQAGLRIAGEAKLAAKLEVPILFLREQKGVAWHFLAQAVGHDDAVFRSPKRLVPINGFPTVQGFAVKQRNLPGNGAGHRHDGASNEYKTRQLVFHYHSSVCTMSSSNRISN